MGRVRPYCGAFQLSRTRVLRQSLLSSNDGLLWTGFVSLCFCYDFTLSLNYSGFAAFSLNFAQFRLIISFVFPVATLVSLTLCCFLPNCF